MTRPFWPAIGNNKIGAVTTDGQAGRCNAAMREREAGRSRYRADFWRASSCNSARFGLSAREILGRYDEEWVQPVPLFFVTGLALENE
jgi:hypothetical protein